MRRLAENEKPLVLALRWSKETEFVRKFLLQENETGDILVRYFFFLNNSQYIFVKKNNYFYDY